MPSAKTRDMGDDVKDRGVFDQNAQDYDKARPHYPAALLDALVKKTGLQSNATLLEIGPGTGQATIPLAERGYTITAIELGDHLARIARQNLEAYRKVEVLTGSFEDVQLPEAAFDLLYSATAFHWIDHTIRYTKSYRLLKPGGHLAFIQTNHVSDEQGDTFYYATQPIYDKYMPSKGTSVKALPRAKDLDPDAYEPTASLDTTLFTTTHFEWFPLVIEYDADQYIELIGTYSPQLRLETAVRSAFFTELKQLINKHFDGTVIKHYAMSLAVTKKIA